MKTRATPAKFVKRNNSRLLLTSSLALAMAAGYGRQSYAGACAVVGPPNGTYLCTLPANVSDTTQVLSATGSDALTVTTADGFGLNTTMGNGFTLTAAGDDPVIHRQLQLHDYGR